MEDPGVPPGARGAAAGRDGKGGPRKKFFVRRRKVCKFCAEKIEYIDWKDIKMLQGFIPERGKILPRRISGTCALHQRKLQTAIKRARSIALLAVRDGLGLEGMTSPEAGTRRLPSPLGRYELPLAALAASAAFSAVFVVPIVGILGVPLAAVPPVRLAHRQGLVPGMTACAVAVGGRARPRLGRGRASGPVSRWPSWRPA